MSRSVKHFSTSKTKAIAVFAVVFLACAVRLAAWHFMSDKPPSTDWTDYYLPAAHSIRDGSFLGRPHFVMSTSPLFVGFLALTSFAGGNEVPIMRVFQILLDTCVVFILWRLANRIFGERIAHVTALIYAFYPPAVYMSGLGQPEVLLTLVLTLSCLAWMNQPSIAALSGTGFLLGLAILIKPNYLLLVPFLGIAGLLFPPDGRLGWLRRFLPVCAGFFLVVIPWQIFRSALPFEEHDAASMYARILYAGSVLRPSLSDGTLVPLAEFYENLVNKYQLSTRSFLEILEMALRNWWQYLVPNPLILVRFLGLKLHQVLCANNAAWIPLYLIPVQWTLFCGSVAGIVMCWRQKSRREAVSFSSFVILYTVSALMCVTPVMRETLPIAPLFIMYAAYAAAEFFSMIARRETVL